LCLYFNFAIAVLLLILFCSILDQGNQARRLGTTPTYLYRVRVQTWHQGGNCRI
jgi:hypothetical protein